MRQEDGVWYDVNTDLEQGDKRKEAIDEVKLLRQEGFAANGRAVFRAAPPHCLFDHAALNRRFGYERSHR